jgi:hypothetical protein
MPSNWFKVVIHDHIPDTECEGVMRLKLKLRGKIGNLGF